VPDHLAALRPVLDDVVAPHAVRTDAEGRYPTENVDALRAAGLLGLVSAPETGGLGGGPRAAAEVVGRIAEHCPSTAMVVCMHYSATAVLEQHGDDAVRREIAAGRHVSTLAFSERGSRSHFWAPLSTAVPADAADGDRVVLDARKSWVTGAGHADSYVWSSRPARADGASTLWWVPAGTDGLTVDAPFDGLGLRGNASSPVSAVGAAVPAGNRLGEDGAGFDIMIGTVLPWFTVLNAAVSLGIMRAALARAAAHVAATRLEHLDQTLADNPVTRLHLARARVRADVVESHLDRTLAAMTAGSDDATLLVLQIKAAAGDAALEVTDACMRVCGGSAFRKEVGVERLFRDARAASVMAPTSDVLYDFVGRATTGLPVF
jgi:alkylation response protein AidB-like acyl-CoA dehydrogenase